MVSPVVSAAATIAVPSIRPTTISALRARRRLTFRIASLTRIGLRTASAATTAAATISADREDHDQRVNRDAEELVHGLAA